MKLSPRHGILPEKGNEPEEEERKSRPSNQEEPENKHIKKYW